MRKYLKLSMVLVLTALFALVAAGCGGPKTSPEESMRIYANMVVKVDYSEAAKVGYSEEEMRKSRDDQMNELGKQAKIVLDSFETKTTSVAKERFVNMIMKVNERVEVKSELVSKQDKTAIVKVSIRSMDLYDFLENTLFPQIQQKMIESPYKWKEEGAIFISEMYESVIDTLPMRGEPVTFEVNCNIDEKTNCWKPADLDKFQSQVLEANDGKM